MKIAVLMTCFNRKSQTLQCLESLRRAIEAYNGKGSLAVDIWLNNDGCTDGTPDAVRGWFDSIECRRSITVLHVISGSGVDYWCGGMRRAWNAAVESGVDYEGYLWLNDDTWLMKDGLRIMLSAPCDSMVVGAITDRDFVRTIYGGMFARAGLVEPDGTFQDVEKAHGNCVYVPRTLFQRVGIFKSYLTHALGDADYSRTAVECGFRLVLTPSWVATCQLNLSKPMWVNPHVPLLKRLENLYSPLGYCEPHIYFRYCLAHDGLFVALKSFVLQHIRVLLPMIWRTS